MTVAIHIGDCRDVLRRLPDESVHCVVTSPPYWGLRDYGTAKWEGGDAACGHIEVQSQARPGRETPGGRGGTFPHSERAFKSECGKCGAIRIDSQIGLEPDFRDYIAAMVAVFREVRRVLRKDGTLWLNLGDTYAGGGRGGGSEDCKQRTNVGSLIPALKWSEIFRPGNPEMNGGASNRNGIGSVAGLKPKDLCGIPWRVAFALQEDGWYLRSDIIWSKPNPMPESVTDRPTKSHEYIFLLSKSERYFYDADAIAEPATYGENRATFLGGDVRLRASNLCSGGHIKSDKGQDRPAAATRNKRSVWEVATAPFSEAHFATFPPALIEPGIKAGTSEKGCCSKCGAPWVRDTTKPSGGAIGQAWNDHSRDAVCGNKKTASSAGYVGRSTTGWSASCKCDADAIACTVLDPFGGAGTTGLVADRLQRSAILIELKPEYAEMTDRRITSDGPLFTDVSRETWTQMWQRPFDFSQEPGQ